ncbi:glycosyl transferase [Enterococcus casseliflavus]|uniref:glycosyltransferase n=1 Tax=Enterococcus casseliflavus TaxID=37734 RepID=UPI001C8C64B2|nr:glycosyl transferase [Enterococcus casseliflavus]MBX9116580.1 glycosyl transferase [Enterococcus casseliflavus]MBX9127005.1 glycosyl transferase [Enterococcus casseliflavus]
MPTILFAPAVFNLAETTRMIEVAKQMQGNHHCEFFGFSKTFASLITESGFTYHLLTPTLTEKQEEQIIKLDQLRSIKNPFTKEMVAARILSEQKLIDKLAPQVIVTGSNVTIFLSARSKQIPLVYVKPYAMSDPFFRSDSAFIPSSLRFFGPLWYWIRKQLVKSRWMPRAFKHAAQTEKLFMPETSLRMMDADLNLITTPDLFLTKEQLPENYQIVGPIFSKLGSSLPDEVLTFIQQKRRERKRIVYFAMGSSGNPRMVRKILAFLRNRSELAIIAPVTHLLKGKHNDSENLFLTEYLPSHLLHEHIDFSFIHGGEGTVQTACASGKPFIGIGMHYEQCCNIQYCVAYGNAIALTKPLTEKKLEAALTEVGAPKICQQAYQLKKDFPTNGPQKAMQEIEHFLEKNNFPKFSY